MSSGPGADDKPADTPVNPIENSVDSSSGAKEANPASSQPAANGPLSIDRIRQLRASQTQTSQPTRPPKPTRQAEELAAAQVAARAVAEAQKSIDDEANKPASIPEPGTAAAATATPADAAGPRGDKRGDNRGKGKGDRGDRKRKPFQKDRNEGHFVSEPPLPKLEVPSRRAALPADLQNELDSALAGTDLDRVLIGDAMVKVGQDLEEGQRIQGRIIKIHNESVFVSLGGPNEGVLSILQFLDLPDPEPGATIEVIVRSYLNEEGLYELTMPGGAISVADWDDLKEGEVVEAKVTAANTGGLECTVGQVRGFIPASQVAEYRIEDFSEFIDQKVLCVVTQANPSRGNLILSRRAVLEREKAEKREQRLAELEIGASVEGTVRKIMDFGAFVDIGGLDGLLHISQLSWEKVKHPSEVVQEGQKIQVRVDKVDPQSGKISLSYRSLQDHPWTGVESRFPVGAIVRGTVSRIAEFGAFVRLATGLEGLVHLSELAHHRVHKVTNHVKEGQEVDVKVLSIEADRQRMSLSLKAASAPPVVETKAEEPEVEEAPRELALPKHRGPLKGGTGKSSGGEQFGLKW